MNTAPSPEPPAGDESELARMLRPGVILLRAADAEIAFADPRALSLLRCADPLELAARWPALRGLLAARGVDLAAPPPTRSTRSTRSTRRAEPGPPASAELDPDGALEALEAMTALRFHVYRDAMGGCLLLVEDGRLGAALESDLRLASNMRSLAQITPAVAHDQRAPINSMVLNLEVLHESLAPATAGQAGDSRSERQQRYVNVLRQELARLHQSLEVFLAHASPRGDRPDLLDLRQSARDLASLLVAPARKQLVTVATALPEDAVPIAAPAALLRQALLHLGLAALARVPQHGTLELRVERRGGRALLRLRIGGAAPASPPAAGRPAPPHEPASGLSFTTEGTEARLYVARSILASLGGGARSEGAVRAASAAAATSAAGEPAEAAHGFEIDLPLAESSTAGG